MLKPSASKLLTNAFVLCRYESDEPLEMHSATRRITLCTQLPLPGIHMQSFSLLVGL